METRVTWIIGMGSQQLRLIYNQLVTAPNPCAYWRAQLPHWNCADKLLREGIHLSTTDYFSPPFDAYVFHRHITAELLWAISGQKTLADLGRRNWANFRRQGFMLPDQCRFVWELDDDPFAPTPWEPAGRDMLLTKQNVEWSRDLADLIVTSTEPLAKLIARPDKTVVCPNLVATDWWVEPKAHKPVRIMYAGSPIHSKELLVLVDAYQRLEAEYGLGVEFIVFGLDPPQEIKDLRRVNRIAHTDSMTDFFRILGEINPDVAVAPLMWCEYHAAKSNIKWLEATGAGAAFLASDVTPYHCIRDGTDGMLVRDGDWYAPLKWMIDNPAARLRMASEARERIRAEWSWESPARDKWLDMFRRAVHG